MSAAVAILQEREEKMTLGLLADSGVQVADNPIHTGISEDSMSSIKLSSGRRGHVLQPLRWRKTMVLQRVESG
jgi:hypothetical protein